jgi:hypothetical protein
MNRSLRSIRAAFAAVMLVVFVVGAAPVTAASTPESLNLFRVEGFRFQDPNRYACTAAATMDMLNWIRLNGTGGTGFRWKISRTPQMRDAILAWERTHDTLAGGRGSDPHGWRNALNFYGWGITALRPAYRRYEDRAFNTYDKAVKAAVRALTATRKPVGVIGWAGRHAQIIVGYYGLSGDPFVKNAAGIYTNEFSVEGFFLVDPLVSQAMVNVQVSYDTFKGSENPKLRFQPYLETDSPYDDAYSPGYRRSREEWYGKFVTVMPIR